MSVTEGYGLLHVEMHTILLPTWSSNPISFTRAVQGLSPAASSSSRARRF